MKLELWTLIPAVFIGGLFIRMVQNISWEYFLIFNSIFISMVGLVYVGGFIKEKIKW